MEEHVSAIYAEFAERRKAIARQDADEQDDQYLQLLQDDLQSLRKS